MVEEFKLSKEVTADLNAKEKEFNFIRKEIKRMEKAGLDVTDLKAKVETADRKRKGMIKEFGQ